MRLLAATRSASVPKVRATDLRWSRRWRLRFDQPAHPFLLASRRYLRLVVRGVVQETWDVRRDRSPIAMRRHQNPLHAARHCATWSPTLLDTTCFDGI